MEAVGIADTAVNEVDEALLEAADGLCVGDDKAKAVDDGLGAQGGDEGRNLQDRDDGAVEKAQRRADDHNDQQHNEHIHFGDHLPKLAGVVTFLDQDTGKAGGKTNLTAGGQVRALGDQTAGDTERNEEADGSVAHEVAEVFPGEEVIFGKADDDRDDDQHHNDRVRFDVV